MIICKVCQRECKSVRSLSKHITQTHHYRPNQYYDEFINTETPCCEVCGSNKISFINLGEGYNKTCSHKCACTLHRATLLESPDRYAKFVSAVSNNQRQIWKERRNDGTELAIRKKIGKTISTNNASLTSDERKTKFDWMNSWSEDELAVWKNSVMLTTGAHIWWKTATAEEKSHVYNKRSASRLGISIDDYCAVTRDPIQEYYSLVSFYTETSFRKHKEIIDPENLRGNFFHLDHKYSILRGFYDGVSPEIIGSIVNLQIISAAENIRKSVKCSITLETLLENYYAQI